MALTQRSPVVITIAVALVALATAASLACERRESETGTAPTTAVPEPEVLALAPSGSPAEVQELLLSWKPISGIDRFVICETTPPLGTRCADQRDVSQATVAVPGPIDDLQATGTWIKYLWLQACGERECSRPPTMAGAIARRVAYGTNAWNFVVVARTLERGQIQVALANASRGDQKTSTLAVRTRDGIEIGRCDDVASGQWCGPFDAFVLSNELEAQQVYAGVGVTLELPIVPVTTAPEGTPQPDQ